MNIINQIKDKAKRHKERHKASDHQFIIADSIAYTNLDDWNQIAKNSSVFLSSNYLSAIETCSPEPSMYVFKNRVKLRLGLARLLFFFSYLPVR